MVDINEIECIEETEYFKFQHGSCFCMIEEENKKKRETVSLKDKLVKNNFMISNVKQKGFYFLNNNINIFSLSDFLYKIDSDKSNINIKSLKFEENIILIENNKPDLLAFIYTDKQNIYIFNYTSDEIEFHCKVDIAIRKLKHI
ncbi:conserved protein, unknown function, partial [Hepatocystis sp. ex Piliocolobus tephrosceles]